MVCGVLGRSLLCFFLLCLYGMLGMHYETSERQRAGFRSDSTRRSGKRLKQYHFFDRLRGLMSEGADIKHPGLANLFQLSAYHGKKDIVEFFLNEGVIETERTGTYSTALQIASANGHVAVVELFLTEGVIETDPTGTYRTALQTASANGQVAVVKLFLTEGVIETDPTGTYGTALQAASANGHMAVVELLLANRTDEEKEEYINIVGECFNVNGLGGEGNYWGRRMLWVSTLRCLRERRGRGGRAFDCGGSKSRA
ncbi:ankyrin repeat-containing domain protein [Mycena rosella]|uniref:Ankyrin repeat-containing domain protein n=1 Tax=Mycena rosella TaxID=1033263 RepID=A0AAD7GIC3_MYCRO|nr:ankyrin repeat-containing domain protein [Mycena rosella]